MGTAEDAIRRRQGVEGERSTARALADAQEAKAIIARFPPLGVAIAQELDRLEWTGARLHRPNNKEEMAFYIDGTIVWAVGSDKNVYLRHDDYSGPFWAQPSDDRSYSAALVGSVLAGLEKKLTELRAQPSPA